MAMEYKLSYTGSQINEKLNKIDSLAAKSEIPTKISQLTNDVGFITSMPNISDSRTILEETTIEHEGQINDVDSKNFEVGKKYAVIVDGVPYVTTCKRVGEDAEAFDYIGNMAAILPEYVGTEQDTGEPFIGLLFLSSITFGFADGASHKVAICNINEFDEAVANNKGSGEAFVVWATENGIDKTNAQIYEAFLQNRPIYGCGVYDGMVIITHPVHIEENAAIFVANAGTSVIGVTYINGEFAIQQVELVTADQLDDYWTSADKTEIVNSVLAALPTWTGGSY
jgi:hypothetical protein